MLTKKLIFLKHGFLALLLVFVAFPLSGQEDKQKIKAKFDSIAYYPDSTIRFACNLKGHTYGIVFDSIGEPILIGKCSNGLKQGRWLRWDGATVYYEADMWAGISQPDNQAERTRFEEEFEKQYKKLLR